MILVRNFEPRVVHDGVGWDDTSGLEHVGVDEPAASVGTIWVKASELTDKCIHSFQVWGAHSCLMGGSNEKHEQRNRVGRMRTTPRPHTCASAGHQNERFQLRRL